MKQAVFNDLGFIIDEKDTSYLQRDSIAHK